MVTAATATEGPPQTKKRETIVSRAIRLGLYASPMALLMALGKPVCLYALVLHAPCPGCGLTRATLALAAGDFATATQMNPIAIVVCPIAVAMMAFAVGHYLLTGRTGLERRWLSILGISLCLALAVVWGLRMFGLFGGPVPV